MSGSTQSNQKTVGSGGIVTAAGTLAQQAARAVKAYSPNSQIAPPAQAGPAAGIAARNPQTTQARIANRITSGTQR